MRELLPVLGRPAREKTIKEYERVHINVIICQFTKYIAIKIKITDCLKFVILKMSFSVTDFLIATKTNEL